ncbi:MAG: pilus assembly PilX N-terminal domain-containing protein [Candidatus Schekmanbacteria bacterium]|nr:pilus assembly PilX N-terminal domain-containing protein [Candidatus Schekmanbacteria bacterium]
MTSMRGHAFAHLLERLRHDQRGVALLLTLMVLTIVLIGAMALTLNSMTESTVVMATDASEGALNAAQSGIASALSWINNTPSGVVSGTEPVDVTDEVNDFIGIQNDDESHGGAYPQSLFSVVVDPRNANQNSSSKYYLIRSTGKYTSAPGKTSLRQLEAVVEQLNFAGYSYFTTYELSSLGGTIWIIERDSFDGPVHTNDQFHIKSTATGPIFSTRAKVTSVATDYVKYSPSQPAVQFNGGYEFGVEPIPLPENTAKLNAYASGGILLTGDTYLTFYVDPTGPDPVPMVMIENRDFSTKPQCTDRVTVAGAVPPLLPGTNFICRWPLLDPWRHDSSTQGAPGTANGIIAVQNGSLRVSTHLFYPSGPDPRDATWWGTCPNGSGTTGPGCWDTVGGNGSNVCPCNNLVTTPSTPDLVPGLLGQVTLASDQSIYIDNDVTYYDAPPAGTSVLGMVASQNILFTDNETTTAPAGGNDTLTVQAVLMALETSIQAHNWAARGTGILNLLGGLIQERRGIVGTFSGSTVVSGFVKNYQYDARLANTPPPYFPTTGIYTFMNVREREMPLLIDNGDGTYADILVDSF